MSDLFVISAGGTGAKVVESLIHLLAAGAGPARVHLLIIDSDTTNGNVSRALETVTAYQRMAKMAWASRGRPDELARIRFFGAAVELETITEQIKAVHEGGLRNASDDKIYDVLDLLFDRDEQGSHCIEGFEARPNLGCLLMARHLKSHLDVDGRFLSGLGAQVGDASVDRVPIVVVGSVFGGTGASVFPVVRALIEEKLSSTQDDLSKLNWGAVMLTPHYLPEGSAGSVDPSRYLVDTSNALRFYGLTEDDEGRGGGGRVKGRFDVTYVVGSDELGRNRVPPAVGGRAQMNPSFVEEVVAASALLELANVEHRENRVLVLDRDVAGWPSLPIRATEPLQLGMSYLLHLAGFHLRAGNEARRGLDRGMGQIVRQDLGDRESLELSPWFVKPLRKWVPAASAGYRDDRSLWSIRRRSQTGRHSIEAGRELYKPTEYFGLLIRWVSESLGRGFVSHSSDGYPVVYTAMSEIEPSDVDADGTPPSEDNALARLLRCAVLGLAAQNRGGLKRRSRFAHFDLFDENGIRIRTSREEMLRVYASVVDAGSSSGEGSQP